MYMYPKNGTYIEYNSSRQKKKKNCLIQLCRTTIGNYSFIIYPNNIVIINITGIFLLLKEHLKFGHLGHTSVSQRRELPERTAVTLATQCQHVLYGDPILINVRQVILRERVATQSPLLVISYQRNRAHSGQIIPLYGRC